MWILKDSMHLFSVEVSSCSFQSIVFLVLCYQGYLYFNKTHVERNTMYKAAKYLFYEAGLFIWHTSTQRKCFADFKHKRVSNTPGLDPAAGGMFTDAWIPSHIVYKCYFNWCNCHILLCSYNKQGCIMHLFCQPLWGCIQLLLQIESNTKRHKKIFYCSLGRLLHIMCRFPFLEN